MIIAETQHHIIAAAVVDVFTFKRSFVTRTMHHIPISNPSPAGLWGDKRRKELKPTDDQPPTPLTSTARQEFDGTRFHTMAETHSKDPFARYRKFRDENPMILTFKKEKPRHLDAYTTYSNVREDPPLPLTTTTRSMNDWLESSAIQKMNRSMAMTLRDSDAPIAVGRSGARVERGAASVEGLIGERLSLSTEPSKNSFVQRSWMYQSDPALLYRTNGVPVAAMPEGMSLPIGENHQEEVVHWNHSRRAVLTGDVMTRTGAARADIFLDDNDYA